MNKSEIVDILRKQLKEKLSLIEQEMSSLNSSLANESKSTAGDKHETGRAMVQLEQEKLSSQLLILQKNIQLVNSIDSTSTSNTIALGSLIKANNNHYFISIALGQLTFDGKTIFCLSPTAPLAQHFLGKKQGDSFQFNGQQFGIEEVK